MSTLKLALLQLCFLAAISAQDTEFLPIPPPQDDSNVTHVKQYYDGLFAYFNLQQTEMSACYSQKQAGQLIDYWKLSYQLETAFIKADKETVNSLFPTFQILNETLTICFQCQYATADYLKLLLAMGVEVQNITTLINSENLYLQAHIKDYHLFYSPIYLLIMGKQFYNAGLGYGPVLQMAVNNASLNHKTWEQLTSFMNGIYYYWNQTLPSDVIYCSDEEAAKPQVYLIGNWTQTVVNTTIQQAAEATEKFFREGLGKELYQQIPSGVKACQQESYDALVLSEIIGFDVFSAEFKDGVVKYYNKSPVIYWNFFNEMQYMYEQNNAFQAGTIFGGFLYDVQQMLFNGEMERIEV